MRELLVYVCFWPVLLAIAIVNGVLREFTYSNWVAEIAAHQVSTLLAAAIFGAAVVLLARHVTPRSSKQAIHIGVIWLVLTLCFEFLFGHYVAGHSWARLVQDYDLLSGRVWPLLLVWTAILPYLVFRLYGSAV